MKTFADLRINRCFTCRTLCRLVGDRDEVITVSVDSAYPDEAAALANNVVTAFEQYQTDVRKNKARDQQAQYEHERDEKQKEIERLTKQIDELRKFNPELAVSFAAE